MIDILTRTISPDPEVSDRDQFVALGHLLGTTGEGEDGELRTAHLFEGMNLAVIGWHHEPTGETVIDGEGVEVPVLAAVPGWWVLVRVAADFPVDAMIGSIPGGFGFEVVWRSDVTDENDEPLPRPAGSPPHVWL